MYLSRRYGAVVAQGCLWGYTFYEVVSGERLCRSYCMTAGGFAPESTPSPPYPVASDSDAKDDDDNDGDDDDASNDDGDASSTDEMST